MNSMVNSLRSDEDGYVLVVTLFLLLMLSVIGIAAIQTSSVEMKISGNTKRSVENFYLTEGAIVSVLEKSSQWLDEDFLELSEKDASWSGHVDSDADGVDDALVEIRCVENSQSEIKNLSPAANMVPVDHHVSSPPANSGYSLRHFSVRKFAVTATDLRDGNKLQSGVWKVFGRY